MWRDWMRFNMKLDVCILKAFLASQELRKQKADNLPPRAVAPFGAARGRVTGMLTDLGIDPVCEITYACVHAWFPSAGTAITP
jgi:hypothetical protein